MEWINYNERQRLKTIDRDKKSVEGVLTTETPVLIFDYNRFDVIREILLVDGMKAPKKVPLLNSHQRNDIKNVIGSTTDFRIVEENGEKIILCRNELSNTELDIWSKIEEGHIDSTSVGYKVSEKNSVVIAKGEKKEINGRIYENNERIDLVVRTEWMPVENSLVPIGADSQAKLRDQNNNNISEQNLNKQMKKLIEMQEKLDDLIQRNEAVLIAKETEKRELTEDEVTAIEATEKEIDLIERQIALEKRHESRKREVVKNEEVKVKERYSIAKAVRIAGGFAPMEGLEAEMHQEAVREARESGQSIAGIGIPHMIINPESERTYVTTTATGAGALIKETYRGINEGLLPKLLVGQLGGRVTSNKGKIVTIKTNNQTAVWETEIADGDEKKLTFTKATYEPFRLGAYTPVSRTMLIQDGYGLEGRMVNDLMNAMKITLDAAAINGGGTTEPTGILNWTGKTTVAMGVNGLAPTRAKLLEMEKGIDTAKAELNGLKWLTTPGIKEYLRNLNVDSGSGLFVWGENGNILGYPGYTTTQVPSTLNKGGSTGVCHAIILGDFSKVEMAQFGGYDIIVDPYSEAKKNIVNVWANSYWNVIIDYPESFAVIVDALTT